MPAGTVTFTYTSTTVTHATTLGTATLANGVATYSALLPEGTDSIVATYTATGNYGGSASTNSIQISVQAAPPIPAATAPIALPYTLTTIAGGGTTTSNATCIGHTDTFGDGCAATAVMITGTGTAADLRSVAADPFGNVYFTDANAALVRRVGINGIVTNFAGYVTGTACVPTSTTGCTPTLVKLTGKPRGIYSDPQGDLFIAGYGDNKVQMVGLSDGKMYLVAGTGSGPTNTTDPAGDGGPAVSALLKGPRAAATDAAGNIYIADSGDNRIREVLNPASGLPGAGNIQTVAGTGVTSSTGDGGLATIATISNPQGVAVDTSGNLYISESSHVRVVCVACSSGSGLSALLVKLGVSAPANGNIYTIAGTASSSNPSLTPGLGTTVNMSPQKISLDPNGNLYIADSGNNVVWFEDGRTGYTSLLVGGGTAFTCTGSAIGDGCVATQGIVGSNGGNGFGIGLDGKGNLYVSDSTNLRIRKVLNNLRFPGGPVGAAIAQTVKFHFLPGDTPATLAVSSSEFALSTGNCIANKTDTTTDCTYSVTFTPKVAGLRTSSLGVATSLGNPGTLGLSGNGVGAGATLDPATQLSFGTNVTPNAIAIDNSGNVFVADSGSETVLEYAAGSASQGSAAVGKTVQSFMNPAALATDSMGNVYVADATTGFITVLSPNGTSRTLSTSFSAPRGLAVDALDNLYVADAGAKTLTEIGVNGVAARTLVTAGLTAPGALAVDSNSNVFVADSSAGAVYRIDGQTLASSTVTTAATAPRALAIDAAGNLIIADSSSNQLLAIPANTASAPFAVATGLPANALAMDGAGNLYTASATNQLLELLRTQATTTFNGTAAAPATVSLLSTGNAIANLALTSPDQTNFALAFSTSNGCSGTAAAIVVTTGSTCQFTSTFTPSSRNNFTNTATLAGNAANAALATPPTLEIIQTGNNAPFPVALTFGSSVPASPVVGDTIMLNASITSIYGTPSGTVVFSVDGNALPASPVSNGAASTTVSGLTAGNHNVAATFTSSDPAFANASATAVVLTVQKASANVMLSIDNASQIYGAANSATVTIATSSGTPTGTVQFLIDGVNSGTPVPVSGGIAKYALPTLTAGKHVITAAYSGDSSFASANAAGITVTVSQATAAVALTTNPSTANTGASIMLTANVTSSAGAPSGTIQFFTGSTALGSPVQLTAGIATLSTTALPSGRDSVTATYSGDTNFGTITSLATTVIVKTLPTLALTVSPAIPVAGEPQGQNETFTATLSSASSATGTVTFLDGASPLGAAVALTNGSATFSTNAFAVGTHSITAQYSGDTLNAGAASTPLTFTTLSSLLPGFAASSVSSLTVAAGGSATGTLTLTPGTLYGGTITLSCASPSATLTCSMSPASLTFSTSTSIPQTAAVTVTASANQARLGSPFPGDMGIRLAAIFGLPGLAMLGLRRQNRSRLMLLLLLAAATCGLYSVTGCAGSGANASGNVILVITATDGKNSQNIPVYVTVTR